jgi:catechol 2,3-dioxygenase-like lactoylglutathione lyase family enzyme
MLRDSTTMSGFSVDDPEAARGFYEDILGLRVEAGDHGFLMLKVADGRDVLVYPSPQHRPGSYTVLNFHVPDIEVAVRDLAGRGVVFEKYAGTQMATDALGVFRKGGPLIAWFADPAGNLLSVIEQPGS